MMHKFYSPVIATRVCAFFKKKSNNKQERYFMGYSASERSERAQSLFMSIEISDIYIYIYMWPYVNLYAHAREIIAKKRP